ncbi:hypothetical protein Tco_0258254, partial [Tanacetum coccineum]
SVSMAETRSIDEVYEELMAEFYQIDADKKAARKANKKGKQMVEDRGRGSDFCCIGTNFV